MWVLKWLLASMLLALIASPALAQQMYVYPAKGQSAAQQQQDQYECSNWATQQTGFNPAYSSAPNYQPSAPPPPGVFGTAARGAAVGAVGGAIGGNAGKGAAIGAATGAVFGGIRRHNYEQQQQYQYSQQSAAYSNQQADYTKAMSACLVGRGYSVQ